MNFNSDLTNSMSLRLAYYISNLTSSKKVSKEKAKCSDCLAKSFYGILLLLVFILMSSNPSIALVVSLVLRELQALYYEILKHTGMNGTRKTAHNIQTGR